jgi:hypothetical protein
MQIDPRRNRSKKTSDHSFSLDRKLASYLAASASIGAVIASDASAIVISNPVTQHVGINGAVNIDFNSDGQTDFQIDHDRVDLTPQGGPVVDYLQVDKNDINGASPGENPLASDPLTGFQAATFPTNGTSANNSAYLVPDNPSGGGGPVDYPAALLAGAEIGSTQFFDFQEGESVYGTGKTGRLNRLIDEDHGQVDMLLGGKSSSQIFTPANSPQFLGVQNLTRYVGVKAELNGPGTPIYGWVGVKVTNEADATGDVVGWGYETQPGVSILAGTTGARGGDYNNDGKVDAADYILWRKGGSLQNETVTIGSNTPEDYTPWRVNYGGTLVSGSGSGLGPAGTVPEPGSMVLSFVSGLGLVFVYCCRRIRGK